MAVLNTKVWTVWQSKMTGSVISLDPRMTSFSFKPCLTGISDPNNSDKIQLLEHNFVDRMFCFCTMYRNNI